MGDLLVDSFSCFLIGGRDFWRVATSSRFLGCDFAFLGWGICSRLIWATRAAGFFSLSLRLGTSLLFGVQFGLVDLVGLVFYFLSFR